MYRENMCTKNYCRSNCYWIVVNFPILAFKPKLKLAGDLLFIGFVKRNGYNSKNFVQNVCIQLVDVRWINSLPVFHIRWEDFVWFLFETGKDEPKRINTRKTYLCRRFLLLFSLQIFLFSFVFFNARVIWFIALSPWIYLDFGRTNL